jgi:hypothetical protein
MNHLLHTLWNILAIIGALCVIANLVLIALLLLSVLSKRICGAHCSPQVSENNNNTKPSN